MELGPCSLSSIAAAMVSTLAGAAAKKNCTVVVQVSENVPTRVLADVCRLEHVVSNMLSNAIKFSPPGGLITVSLDCDGFSCGGDNATVTWSFIDAGVGVSLEHQALLFQNFSQIRPGTLQQGQGSGLGLSFCKHIVETHKGHVGVRSEPGEGSTFFFTIPFVVLPPDNTQLLATSFEATIKDGPEVGAEIVVFVEAEAASVAVVEAIVPSVAAPIVLVVDDSASNRKMLQMLLLRKGVVSESCDDGLACCEKIRSAPGRYQLILMDNLMPVLNGLDACKILRDEGFQPLIVGITGNVFKDDMDEYLAAGADMVLTKPCGIATVERLLAFVVAEGFVSRPGHKIELSKDEKTFVWVPGPTL